MAPIAAVMTGPGAGAIATIQLLGDSAEAILRGLFLRTDRQPFEVVVGRVFLGDIIDKQEVIDQVTVGCEGPDAFAIHCHGNPLIVERIMGLLQRHGVQPVRAEQLLTAMTSRDASDSIAVEAKLALATVKTVDGARIIVNQTPGGLAAKARQWQADLASASLSVEQIAAEAKQIRKDSDTARLIISGCTIVLAGPPNTGKSTLLNTLAGREKAIVTDIRGTTRDWVTAEIRIPPLTATIIDTAGLDPSLAATGAIDQAAQRKSLEAVHRADLILLVLDTSQPADQLSGTAADLLFGRRVIVVLNKADLPQKLDSKCLPVHLRGSVQISAKQETGIEGLIRAVHETCGVLEVAPDRAVTFTDRQRTLIERLAMSQSPVEAGACIAGLLRGPLQRL